MPANTSCSVYTHTHNLLTALCPGLHWWVTTRQNIHPLTPILIIRHPLSTSSSYYSIFLVQFTCLTVLYHNLLQVLFGLPFDLEPCTSYSIHFFARSSPCFCNTFYCSLFCCNTSGPVAWNSLPVALRSSDVTEETFRRHLKTFLFNSLDS